jgi:hypothetical protein
MTGAIALGAILLRDLNVLAPIITLFFLITYGTINLVVLVEETLDLPTSGRLRFPPVVPMFGAVACIVAMVVVNVVFTVIAFAVVIGFLVVLLRRRMDSPFGDVRSDMFAAIAAWASQRAVASRQSAERGWRPRGARSDRGHPSAAGGGYVPARRHLPQGQRQGGRRAPQHRPVAGRRADHAQPQAAQRSAQHDVVGHRREDVRARLPGVDARTGDGLGRSNIVFLTFPGSDEAERQAFQVLEEACGQGLGVLMTSTVHAGRLGGRGVINLWIREQGRTGRSPPSCSTPTWRSCWRTSCERTETATSTS